MGTSLNGILVIRASRDSKNIIEVVHILLKKIVFRNTYCVEIISSIEFLRCSYRVYDIAITMISLEKIGLQ